MIFAAVLIESDESCPVRHLVSVESVKGNEQAVGYSNIHSFAQAVQDTGFVDETNVL